MLAVFSPVYAATNTAFCLVYISLGLAESIIFPAAPADTRPRTPLISFCTVPLWTLCAAHSLAALCLFMTSGPGPGELPSFWGSMVFRHAPIPQKRSGNNNTLHLSTASSTHLCGFTWIGSKWQFLLSTLPSSHSLWKLFFFVPPVVQNVGNRSASGVP